MRPAVLLCVPVTALVLGCTARGAAGPSGSDDAGVLADVGQEGSDALGAPDARSDGRRNDIGDGGETDGYTCHLNDSFVPGACDTCLEANCCAEMNTCFGNADCADLTACAFDCAVGADGGAAADAGSCTAQCEAQHPSQVANFRGWVACLGYSCMQQCQ
jgi:hypothetical protein